MNNKELNKLQKKKLFYFHFFFLYYISINIEENRTINLNNLVHKKQNVFLETVLKGGLLEIWFIWKPARDVTF